MDSVVLLRIALRRSWRPAALQSRSIMTPYSTPSHVTGRRRLHLPCRYPTPESVALSIRFTFHDIPQDLHRVADVDSMAVFGFSTSISQPHIPLAAEEGSSRTLMLDIRHFQVHT